MKHYRANIVKIYPEKWMGPVKYFRGQVKEAIALNRIDLAKSMWEDYKKSGGKLPFTAFYGGKRKVK